jgi:hypothetical protein
MNADIDRVDSARAVDQAGARELDLARQSASRDEPRESGRL